MTDAMSAGAGSGVDGPVRGRLNEIQRGGNPWGAVQMLADEIDRLRGEMEARLVSWESMTRHLDKRVTEMESLMTGVLTKVKLGPDKPSATAAGESETGSGTTHTCGITDVVEKAWVDAVDELYHRQREADESVLEKAYRGAKKRVDARWPDDRISRLAEVAEGVAEYWWGEFTEDIVVDNWHEIVRAILEADEPTPEMIEAGMSVFRSEVRGDMGVDFPDDIAEQIYRAMRAAR